LFVAKDQVYPVVELAGHVLTLLLQTDECIQKIQIKGKGKYVYTEFLFQTESQRIHLHM
jgi:hypothetical protein